MVQFLPNLSERYEFIDSMYNDFSKEFSINKSTKKQIDIKFRENTTIMEEYFNNTEIMAILNRRNKDTILLNIEHKSTVKLKELLWSIIHMTVNRVILDRPRLHELVLYGLLSKYYKRQIGIENYLKMKFVVQHDQMDCGPASLSMIASYYGKDVSCNSLEIFVI